MNIFLNGIVFIMGTFFGSFFTLAIYRIPLKKDITHEHSFCPNCNHKLNMLDLIPIFSYVILRGKCRYCGEKVRIRYLVLEVLSGLVFVIAYLSFNINNIFMEVHKLIYFANFILMYVTLTIVAGIDKEYRKINKSVLLFGAICQILYMIYLYVVENINIYRYIIYILIFAITYMASIRIEKNVENYGIELLLLISYIMIVLDLKSVILIAILTSVLTGILYFIKKEKDCQILNMPFGFLIAFSTIVYQTVENFIQFYSM